MTRRLLRTVIVVSALSLSACGSAAHRDAGSRQPPAATTQPATSSTSAVPRSAPGTQPANVPRSAPKPTETQIAIRYATPSGYVSNLTKVAVKETTWSSLLPITGESKPPDGEAVSGSIDVVVQAGTVDSAAFGDQASGSTNTYDWVASIVSPATGAAEGEESEPNSTWPSWFATLPGTEVDVTPRT
jgi:hypothetical protein